MIAIHRGLPKKTAGRPQRIPRRVGPHWGLPSASRLPPRCYVRAPASHQGAPPVPPLLPSPKPTSPTPHPYTKPLGRAAAARGSDRHHKPPRKRSGLWGWTASRGRVSTRTPRAAAAAPPIQKIGSRPQRCRPRLRRVTVPLPPAALRVEESNATGPSGKVRWESNATWSSTERMDLSARRDGLGGQTQPLHMSTFTSAAEHNLFGKVLLAKRNFKTCG